MMHSPTRADIELILESIPVATSQAALTREKKVARNTRRRDKVKIFLETEFPDPRVIQMILSDLDSYMGYEEEVDNA